MKAGPGNLKPEIGMGMKAGPGNLKPKIGTGPVLRVQTWWPVDEQLPDADLRVCVCTLGGSVYEGFTLSEDDDGEQWYDDHDRPYTKDDQDAIGWWADTTSPLWVDDQVPVKITVRGGVAYVESCPECIAVEIVDHDNDGGGK